MRWASSISDLPDLDSALSAALDDAAHALEAQADLVVVFVSGHGAGLAEVPHRVRERFPRGHLIGCSAGGVVGGGLEIEGRPGVSVTLASMPLAEIVPFRVEDDSAAGIPQGDAHLLLTDPFSVDTPALVEAFDLAHPRSTKFGGLASGGRNAQALWLDDATHQDGAIGLAFRGVTVDTIVAQGCRPIGDAMFVTRHRERVIHELNGKPVVQVIRDLFATLSEREQGLFRKSLFLGVGMDQRKREYRQGDFLVRNVGGLQKEGGGLVVGATLEDYAVVQFHVRDADASALDLEELLGRHAKERPHPRGGLLFSCLGRGQGLYGHPNHDSDAFHRVLGSDVSLGGFFCNGEIGPVNGRTFLHGYTSSFALFR